MDWQESGFLRRRLHNEYRTLEEHCNHKYLLHLEGNTFSGRLKYLLLCASPVIYVQDNELLNNELKIILCLNNSRIRSNRQAVLRAITSELSKYKGKVTKSELQSLLSKWSKVDADGKKTEYSGVAIFYLQNKISKAS